MKYFFSIAVLIIVVQSAHLSAQSVGTITSFGQHSAVFILNTCDSVYQLPNDFVAEGSERVVLDSTVQLKRLLDYRIDYRYGRILFTAPQLKNVSPDTILMQ